MGDVFFKNIKEKVKRVMKELVDVFTTRNNEKEYTNASPQLNDTSKNNKVKVKKRDLHSNDSSFSTKRPKKKKNDVTSPKISSPLLTRSRKRAADTSVSQPNPKSAKRDILSKVASKAMSVVTSSPPNQLSKSTVLKISNTSLPETTIVKEKPLTGAKKKAFNSESSASARKVTRCQRNVKETEIKKLTTITRSTLKTKVQNLDEPTNNSTKVTFNPIVEVKFLSPTPKKQGVKRKYVVAKTKNVSPPPRVLKNKEKK